MAVCRFTAYIPLWTHRQQRLRLYTYSTATLYSGSLQRQSTAAVTLHSQANINMSFLNKIGTKIALQRAGLGNLSLPKDNPFASSTAKGTQEPGGDNGFANPFANVTWPPKAFDSWKAPPPPQTPVREAPLIGERAQTHPKLKVPTLDGRPVVVLFLRYCGCPCKSLQ